MLHPESQGVGGLREVPKRVVGIAKNLLAEAEIAPEEDFAIVGVDLLTPPSDAEQDILTTTDWYDFTHGKAYRFPENWPNVKGEKKLFAIRNGKAVYWMNFADYGSREDLREAVGGGARSWGSGMSRRDGANLVPGVFRGELPEEVLKLFRTRACKGLGVAVKNFEEADLKVSRSLSGRRVGLMEGATGYRVARAMDRLVGRVMPLKRLSIANIVGSLSGEKRSDVETKGGEGWVELVRMGEIKSE